MSGAMMACSVGVFGVNIGVSCFWRIVGMCAEIKMAGKISDA